jgi:capsular polysaccharide transport system permease protein
MQSPKKNRFAAFVLRLLGYLYLVLIVCAVVYVWVFAQDRFISQASFTIARQDPASVQATVGGFSIPGLSDSGSADSQAAIGFVDSADLLLQIEKEFDLRKHYAAPERDVVFRLPMDTLLEDRLDFYRKRIFAHYDKETGLTLLNVDTFDRDLSKRIADRILSLTEIFINELNQSVADQQLAFIRGEVERAEQKVSDISVELLKLQNQYNIVTPDAAIKASLQTVQELKMERIKTETELASIQRDSPNSPRIESIASRMKSLDEQIAAESMRLSGPDQDRLNQVLARYKELDIKLEFAVKMRTSAETLFERHRVEAAGQSRFISIIQTPFRPEAVGYPLRWYATFTILGAGFLLFLILRVLVQSVYERVN